MDDDDDAYDFDVDLVLQKHLAATKPAEPVPLGCSVQALAHRQQQITSAPHVQYQPRPGIAAVAHGAPVGQGACQAVGRGGAPCQGWNQQQQRGPPHLQPLQPSNHGPQQWAQGPLQPPRGDAPTGQCNAVHGADTGFRRTLLQLTSIALPVLAQERSHATAPQPAAYTLPQPLHGAGHIAARREGSPGPHLNQPGQELDVNTQRHAHGHGLLPQPQLQPRPLQETCAQQGVLPGGVAPQAHALAMPAQHPSVPAHQTPQPPNQHHRQAFQQHQQQRPQPQAQQQPQQLQPPQPQTQQVQQQLQPQQLQPQHAQQQPQLQQTQLQQPQLQQTQLQQPQQLRQQNLQPQQQVRPAHHLQEQPRQQHPHPLHEQLAQQQQQPHQQQLKQLPPPHTQPSAAHVPPNSRHPAPGLDAASHPAPPPPNRPVSFSALMVLEENKRFAVKVGYHDGMKAVFGLITGAAYDSAVKGWTFPLAQYNHVMDALTDGRLRTRGVQLTVQQAFPEFVGGMLKAAASRNNDERLYEKLVRRAHESEETLDERMMPFQREGVRHALRLGGRVLIGDEMGLGKTVQACCLLRCYSEDWPALIIVPKSLRETWADALFAWLKLTELDVFVIHNVKDADQLGGPSVKPKIVVVSYDSLLRIPDKLKAMKFRVVVLDEAHYIKNSKAQRTKEAMPLLHQAKRVVLLTGTPALSKPAELVPLLQALMPSAGVKTAAFCERYSVPDKRYPGKYFGARNEPELNKLLQGTVMVRRLKRDVLKDLPAKRRQQVFIRLPDKDTRKVEALSRELEGIRAVIKSMDAAGGAGQGISNEKQQTIMRLWRETAALKAAAVAEYCAELLTEGADAPKFLLFAHHKLLLDAVEQQVKSCKAKYIRIDGSTSSEARAEGVRRFQEDEDVKVAILSIKAAGVGLTLTASSLVVFAELSWVPGDIQQAEDRCHRIGQSSSVNIHFLLVRSSVDEIMWETVQNKLGNVGKVLDGSGAFIKVDATRELHGINGRGYGDNGRGERFGQGGVDGKDHQGGAPETDVGHGGASTRAASGSTGTGRGASGSAAASAGTRRISDFFAPAPNAADGKAAVNTSNAAQNKGTKRERENVDEVELLSDDEQDFKKR